MALGKPSATLLRDVKKFKLPNPQVKAFCDLIVAGWSREDAYIFSGLWNTTYSTIMNHQDMEKLITQNQNVSLYIDERVKEKEAAKRKAKKAEEEEIKVEDVSIDMTTELSKETQLKELLIAKGKHPVGSKEWLDIKKLIADLSKVKNEDLQEEDEYVHFYVPIQCHSCSLYINQKAKNEKK